MHTYKVSAIVRGECVRGSRRHQLNCLDTTGSDLSCLIISLVQMCLDTRYRTQSGLVRLLDKEWSAHGFPFGSRKTRVDVDGEPVDMVGQCVYSQIYNLHLQTPYLLLFMDCIYQLTSLYPCAFDYSHVYIVSLYDTLMSGLLAQFAHDYHAALDEYLNEHRHNYCQLYPLQRFYT